MTGPRKRSTICAIIFKEATAKKTFDQKVCTKQRPVPSMVIIPRLKLLPWALISHKQETKKSLPIIVPASLLTATEPKTRHQPPRRRFWESPEITRYRTTLIAVLAIAGILLHLLLRFGFHASTTTARAPLLAVLALGGIPLV